MIRRIAPLFTRVHRSPRRRATGTAVVVAIAAFGVASSFVLGGGAGAQTTATTVAPSAEAGAAAKPKPITLTIGQTKFGNVLVDGDGLTLYMFTPDWRNVSLCEGQCRTVWPPVFLRKGEALADVVINKDLRRSQLGYALREDGSRQLTYNGWPLYYWFQDKAPGDVKGQFVQSVWFVMNGDGQPITPRP